MAAIDTSRAAFASSGKAPRRGSIFSAILGGVRGWNEARMTRKALNALSDRELDDIGLVRGDIERVAASRR